MNLGAHTSIAGGLERAALRARDAGCRVLQIFTASPRGGPARDPAPEDVRRFDGARRAGGIAATVVHAGYLINLATPVARARAWAVASLAAEIRRAAAVGASDLVLHPGAHVGRGEAEGLGRVARGLDDALRRADAGACRIALEITAGQGTCLGWRFDHLSAILDRVRDPARFSVCFDTCHAFAAGCDLRTRAGVEDALAALDRGPGLDRLTVFHFNDSVKGLGSRVDRHAHLGRGAIGLEAFRTILRDRRFRNVPMILETPKEGAAEGVWDRRNLAVLRALRDGKPVPRLAGVKVRDDK